MSKPDDPYATAPHTSAAGAESVGTTTSSGLRFRIIRPHARGGLGQVSVAIDAELSREVALKEIQGRHADDPESRSRFLLEAEITGGLEHPGIVPVYGLGQYADGRPYYAMRFIRGDSLKDAIERFHKQPSATKDDGERALELRKLLGRFIDVCQAMQYAHDRGVLHRDLKPGNIMLGKYGETLVVDWGLAKAVGTAQKAEGTRLAGEPGASATGETTEQLLVPQSGSGISETQAGQALGTPHYMSPEQAAGRLDELGPASDVYSLGATLYSLLTGTTATRGANIAEVLRNVQSGDFPRPRQLKPDIHPALEAICLKAMALKPAERYTSPGLLADDVERWLGDEPVSAFPEPLTARLGRWARKHKALVSGASAALLMTLIAGTVGVVWYQNEQAKQATAEALRHAEAERKQALAEQSIRAALNQAEQSRADLHQSLSKPGGVFALVNEPARWQAHTQAVRASMQRANALLANTEQGVDPQLAEKLQTLETAVSRDESDHTLALQFERIRLEKASWVEGRFDLSKAAKQYLDAFREANLPVLEGDAQTAASRIAASAIKEQLVAALDDWAAVSAIERQGIVSRLIEVSRLAAADSGFAAKLRSSLADRQALAALLEKGRSTPLSPQLIVLVGNLLGQTNPEREPWLRAGQAQYPSDFWINFELANTISQTKPVEAEGYFRVALAVRPQTSAAYNNLGGVLSRQNRKAEAVAAYEKAIAIDPRFTIGYQGLAVVFRDQRREADTFAILKKALELEPNNASTYDTLGLALVVFKRRAEAQVAYRKAIELNPGYALAYLNLAQVLILEGSFDEAEHVARKLVKMTGHPLQPSGEFQLKQIQTHFTKLGNSLYAKKDLDGAITQYRRAVEIDPSDAAAHTNLGNLLFQKKDLEGASAHYRKAMEINPKHAGVHYNLGIVLRGQNDRAGAIPLFRKAAELDPSNANAHTALVAGLYLLGRPVEAREASVLALKALPEGNPSRPSFERWIQDCDKLIPLEPKLTAYLDKEESPGTPEDQVRLASFCRLFKRYHATAARLFAEGFKAQPKLAEDLAKNNRYDAARSAVLASAGLGLDPKQPDLAEKTKLRRLALDWLRADHQLLAKQLPADGPRDAFNLVNRLLLWQGDPDLVSVRESNALAALPESERQSWQKFWGDVQQLQKDARSRYTETRLQGTLDGKEATKPHQVQLSAANQYAIDMDSTNFDTYLKVQDATGKVLAENDDITEDNRNSRLFFTPPQDGAYRILATSYEQRGTGAYTITIREFVPKK